MLTRDFDARQQFLARREVASAVSVLAPRRTPENRLLGLARLGSASLVLAG